MHDNYFDELGRSYRVATWTQTPCMAEAAPTTACKNADTFDAVYRNAPWALRKLLDETTGPIAIVGHSRGGLVGRRLLKEFGDASSRMPWPGTQHITQPLHHGEVLWYVPTMQRVGGPLRKLP